MQSISAFAAEQFPFWKNLSKEEQQSFCLQVSWRKYSSGALLHSGEDVCLGVLCVQQGMLRISMQGVDGKEATLYRLAKGETCTLSSSCIMQEITFDVLIEAECDCTVLVIDAAYMYALSERYMEVQNYLYRQTIEKFSQVMWTMQQILFMRFDSRLAKYLLAQVEGQDDDIKMVAQTHEHIAKQLSTAREVVSRMLKYFANEGIVILKRKAIILCNIKALRNIAEV